MVSYLTLSTSTALSTGFPKGTMRSSFVLRQAQKAQDDPYSFQMNNYKTASNRIEPVYSHFYLLTKYRSNNVNGFSSLAFNSSFV